MNRELMNSYLYNNKIPVRKRALKFERQFERYRFFGDKRDIKMIHQNVNCEKHSKMVCIVYEKSPESKLNLEMHRKLTDKYFICKRCLKCAIRQFKKNNLELLTGKKLLESLKKEFKH